MLGKTDLCIARQLNLTGLSLLNIRDVLKLLENQLPSINIYVVARTLVENHCDNYLGSREM